MEEKNILEMWKCKWNINGGDELFRDFYVQNYNDIFTKMNKNKESNFNLKKIYLIILLVDIVINLACLFVYIINNWGQVGTVFLFVPAISSFSFFIMTWITKPIIQWEKIKRYQETWVRHSINYNKMTIEMIKYCFNTQEYKDAVNINQIFVEQIILIWQESRKKFEYNMVEEDFFD